MTKDFKEKPLEYFSSIIDKIDKNCYEKIKNSVSSLLGENKSILDQIPFLEKSTNSKELFRFRALVVHDSYDNEVFPLPEMVESLFANAAVQSDKAEWMERKVVQCISIPNVSAWNHVQQYDGSVLVKLYTDEAVAVCNAYEFLGFPCEDEQGFTFHVITLQKLENDCNHLIEASGSLNPEMDNYLCNNLKTVRNTLLSTISSYLRGDALLSELILYHLFSKLKLKKEGYIDSLKLGQLNFNLIVGNEVDFAERTLFPLLQLLLPKVKYLSLDLNVLNNKAFESVMDYDNGILKIGELLLTKGTHLIVDETKLNQGELNEQGIRNLALLKDLIQHQTVMFNFTFPITISTDIPIIVVSEAKSMFSMEQSIQWKPTLECIEKVEVPQDMINTIRVFISFWKHKNIEWDHDVKKKMEDFFVEKRRETSKYSAQDFSKQLELFRLMSMSYGQSEFVDEIWQECDLFYRKWQQLK
ncbi:Mini-chromosome maintenance complex-binding protein domain-containing protein [Rozella allomycis CSF55]|uniref:Mini-chromosome maintenance complex-binding protein domain-containing protein n=1 Tax=Rozella allomycis (strain CSF55) TaxID=988480 RepID=A0A075B3Q7_ROZAC|nr:Mini-chromosome maintenance complex-binding protein domain-containing protein [Rozella allomycis CSF55]|eukprot:EPZ35671.1 Mini-chromosome maintenance complex-binding protein domain-containing protein [Rozella allomycis CSF55]